MIKKILATSLILASTMSCGYANEETTPNTNSAPFSTFNIENLKTIKGNQLANDVLKLITLAQIAEVNENSAVTIDYAQKYNEANEKFKQGNITVAYKDYKSILSAYDSEDFVNLGFAYKFANMGLFTLAQEAINNIQDRETYNNQIQLIKSKLFPQVVLSYDDEIYLAQNYTEIYYNNLAFEVARDMAKLPESLKRADYAHYILSQAYYNIKEYNKAINSINKAISINPDNINYQKYKAQIYCEINRLSEAEKLLENILSQNVNIIDYQQDLEALYYFTKAKANKDREKSRFYLAQYFIKTNDQQRAIKELNQNISTNKKDYKSLTLLADIYFAQKNLAESMDMYEKSYKIKKNYTPNLLGIANMYLFKKDYRNALEYFLKISKKDKNNAEALIKTALCYKMLDLSDKAVLYANKAFEADSNNYNVYYTASQIDEFKNIQYLKKTLSINPLMTEAWLDLADIAIKNNRLELARTYLKPVKYIDAQNSRYYYYSGLINKKNDNHQAIEDNFKKALEIDPFDNQINNELKTQL